MRGRFGGCRHYLVPRGSALNEIRDGGRIDLRHRLLEASAELVKAPGDLNHQTVDRMGNDSHRSAPRLSIRSPSSREPTHTPRLQARAWPSGTVETRLASDNELNLLFRASDLSCETYPVARPALAADGRTSRSPAAIPTAAMRPSPRSRLRRASRLRPADIAASTGEVRQLANDVTEILGGRVDILVNHAGILPSNSTATLDTRRSTR